jgi:hypothetical protein
MARCDVCGNEYAASFEILTAQGQRFTFDSFECAIDKLAPSCAHCGCRIVGHGIESSNATYCCAHCADQRAQLTPHPYFHGHGTCSNEDSHSWCAKLVFSLSYGSTT